jgi:hypothetical protein
LNVALVPEEMGMNESIGTEGEIEPLFITNTLAMRLLAIRVSTYWRLVREKRIVTVGKGRASRASFASIKAYAERRLAEAGAGEKAA